MQKTQIAGHLLVECLIEQGVTHAFGVPGESFLAVLDGFHAYSEKIKFIINRQEGGAANMAEAHGKLTGRPGVCFVTRAPGATNASIGVHTAFQDSTPMVLFIGDVGSDFRDREAFQELDYNAFFGPNTKGMAKRVERIDDPSRLPEYVARAFALAMNGRPGPVVLVLPEDMLRAEVNTRPLPRVEPAQAWCDPGALREMRQMLLESKNPFLLVGGGGWTPQAAKALERFAQNWSLPVGCAFRYQDTFDNHHPLYAGDVGIAIGPQLAQRIANSDLIIALGPRLGEMTTGGYELIKAPRSKQKLIHIHASPDEIGRVYQADLSMLSTMSAAARSLEVLDAPQDIPWRQSSLQAHQDYLDNMVPQVLPGPIDVAELIKVLNRLLPDDAVWTNGAGNFATWAHRFHPYTGLSKGYKTQLAPTSGAMGYGIPAGIAANLLTSRVAFTIAGDGDFLMTAHELATAQQYGAKSIILLLNNGLYGTIRMHQAKEYPGRVSGSVLKNPDFCALAKAYGYAAHRVLKTAEFEPALRLALQGDCGAVIEVPLDPDVITTRITLSQMDQAHQKKTPA
jgi:acetolactate synthase-1/2/3 large subunit